MSNVVHIFFVLFSMVLLPACSRQVPEEEYDLVIRNGWVLDGLGNPAQKADVAIVGDRFVKVGAVTAAGAREIDATGKYVSPGWIDMMDQSGQVLLKNGRAENKVLMGVTSAIGGEGGTAVPAGELRAYFRTLEEQGISINFGSYYNAWQARSAVLAENITTVTDADIAAMQAQMRLAMEAGAVGMSSTAFYPPMSLLTTRELIEMSRAIAPYGGIYAAHMRDESEKLLSAIEEMITIAEQASVAVEIYHFKSAFAPHWGSEIHKAIDLVNRARSRGIDIAANQYPYTAGGTGIDATVPRWVWEEGEEEAVKLLRDPDVRSRLKTEIADPHSDRMVNNSGGWQNITLANAYNEKYTDYHGKRFTEIAELVNKDPADAAWDIMLEALPNRAYALYHLMSEGDVKAIMQQPWVSIGSDAGAAEVLGEVDAIGLPHPRAYGTFPRIIAKYVREDGLLTLADAIRKMTSLSAKRMRLSDRGVIKQGKYADVVIFDYDNIQDNATWQQPLRTPTGIDYVLVNGVVVAEQGKHTGKTPGRVLYGPGYQSQ
ncbi:D-aminoacylase [Exilibacterium tricleocarpae]|uniref:D-aminoacylase n=1 Tax=Exilibacterium tricleocarpae TaxID=2591008 RepID=A0A545SZX3_9GAMM|nr:D-aminoacylase [Exilibacterium tricleocarpae]TQV70526.1 D-aminoacylase [Exilibacterium tricleocarpae]